MGQQLTEFEERAHADLARKAKARELEPWEQLEALSKRQKRGNLWQSGNVLSPVKMGTQSDDLADTRWVSTWKEVDGARTVKARLVATGYQDPDLRESNVDKGCPGVKRANSPRG